ncbi:MAG: retroviral-like aspartic protease family protein [Pseudomonadota bacterium]|nr:retroviral-like aspartic protease family protein [Pseudomonadota bacterium]
MTALCAALCAAGLPACSALSTLPAQPAPIALATLPFTLQDNRIFVDVQINGMPAHVLLDTGGANAITPELAERLHLRGQPGATLLGAGEAPTATREVKIDRFALGPLTLRNQDFLVVDFAPIARAFHFAHFDGMFGAEVLQTHVVALDFSRQQIRLYAPGTVLPESATMTSLPCRFHDDKPLIEARIDGVAGQVILDTGDRSAFTLYPAFANSSGLVARFAKQPAVVSGYGLGGPIPARVGSIDKLELGYTSAEVGAKSRFSSQLAVANVTTRVPAVTRGAFASTAYAGSVGNEVLRRYDWIFDYPRGQLYAKANASIDAPFHFNPPPAANIE